MFTQSMLKKALGDKYDHPRLLKKYMPRSETVTTPKPIEKIMEEAVSSVPGNLFTQQQHCYAAKNKPNLTQDDKKEEILLVEWTQPVKRW